MTYLLDTHYVLWSIADSRKMSKQVKNLIGNPGNEVIVSVISFWEISLKTALGKLRIKGFSPEDLPGLCQQIGFRIAELSAADSSTYHLLKADYHKDPFDRMLIWQAIQNNFTLLSEDDNMFLYLSAGLKLYRQ